MQMKRLAFSVWLVVFSAFSVAAQPLAIHAHPQKATYESPAEWPFLSDQCHWMVGGVLAHTHVEMSVPIYAELTPGMKLTIPVTFKLFHTAGRITTIWSELGTISYDTVHPADPIYPNLVGDPSGVSTWTGTWTLDTARGNGSNAGPFGFSPHGWTVARVVARTVFPDGTSTDTFLSVPFYSMLHPEVPELSAPENAGIPLRAACSPTGRWGAMITEFHDYIPIAPMGLGEIWNPEVFTYSYGAAAGVSGTLDRRLDPDLHNGIVGREITSPFTFDTTFSGLGVHKFSFIWDERTDATPPPDFPANGQVDSLLVVNVTAGDGPVISLPPPPPPPPPSPSPTLPPPPPPPDWTTFTPTFQHLGTRIRICDGLPQADGANCLELAPK